MNEYLIEGEIINLRPYQPSDRNNVIKLRNSNRGQYFLNQGFESTIETQIEWEKGYFTRENDFYWIIECKSKKDIIGTTALYDLVGSSIEKGRLIVDEEKSLGKPYVLEAELLVLKFAFETLKIKTIVTRTKLDNNKMKSINSRFGFEKVSECVINNEIYEVFELEKYDLTKLQKYIDIVRKWSLKSERTIINNG